MNPRLQLFIRAMRGLAVLLAAALLPALPAAQQNQTIPLDKPVVVKKTKPKTHYEKFQGTVMHANIVQITVRGLEKELQLRTFPLAKDLAEKMQQIIDRGGYQYGDKVTVIYDPVTQQAVKIKGKPSRPI